MQGDKKPTIRDVAKLAGLSYGTVSRYINGSPNVSPDAASRIQSAIDELDFIPSASARMLSRRATHLIALIVHDESERIVNDPNTMRIIASANIRVAREGWQLVTLFANDEQSFNNIAQLVGSGFADGYMLLTLRMNDPILAIFHTRLLPAVISGTGYDEPLPCPSIDADNYGAMRTMMDYVFSKNYHNVAHVCGPLDLPGAPERLQAFSDAVETQLPGYNAPVFYSNDWESASGVQAVQTWIADGTLDALDAIVCSNDTLAVGVIDELLRLGKSVPDDIAVTGFDNSSAAISVTPNLTTIDQHMEQKGFHMASVVIDEIKGEDVPKTVLVPTELVVRQSA